MNTSGSISRRNIRGIDNKVADLTEENVDSLPVQVLSVVWIRIDETKAGKVGRGLECRRGASISNQLSKVCWLDGSRNEVSSGREVDNGWGRGG